MRRAVIESQLMGVVVIFIKLQAYRESKAFQIGLLLPISHYYKDGHKTFDRLCRKCCLWAKGHCFKQWERYRSQKPALAINAFPESWALLPRKRVWCWFVGPGRRRGARSPLPVKFTTAAGSRATAFVLCWTSSHLCGAASQFTY